MLTAVALLAGLVFLVAGAESLVRGASRLAAAAGISPLIIGLTIVAFGTSAPELAVSVASVMDGQADIALGNVVGSNIFNVLFILGLSALIIPLVVDQKLVRFDVPLMVAVSALLLLFGLDGRISRLEGAILSVGLVAYTTWCILTGRNEAPEVQQEYSSEFGTTDGQDSRGHGPVGSGKMRLLRQTGQIAIGLVLLVVGSRWFVHGAVELARWFGVNELVIGLTIIAAGTSLPEVATSIIAAIRGERDIAVGNVVGSNIFNILAVLGVAAVLAPDGVAVATQVLQFDIPVMIAVALACLPIFISGHTIVRWEGLFFLVCYVLYTVALVLIAVSSPLLPAYRSLMLSFVVPITALTLCVVSWRLIRESRVSRGGRQQ